MCFYVLQLFFFHHDLSFADILLWTEKQYILKIKESLVSEISYFCTEGFCDGILKLKVKNNKNTI